MEQLESLLSAAGFTREASARSHCGHSVLYLHARVRGRVACLTAFSVGPVAAVLLELQLAALDDLVPAAATGSGGSSQREGEQSVPQGKEPVAAQQLAHEQLGGGASRAQPVRLCIGGCHLAPFAESAYQRLRQLKAFLDEAEERDVTHTILAGDTNMRKSENQAVLDLGLQVLSLCVSGV